MKIIITIWLISAVIGYSGTFAYWQREYPTLAKEQYKQDMGTSIIFGIFPPFMLISIFCSGFYKHGFKLY